MEEHEKMFDRCSKDYKKSVCAEYCLDNDQRVETNPDGKTVNVYRVLNNKCTLETKEELIDTVNPLLSPPFSPDTAYQIFPIMLILLLFAVAISSSIIQGIFENWERKKREMEEEKEWRERIAEQRRYMEAANKDPSGFSTEVMVTTVNKPKPKRMPRLFRFAVYTILVLFLWKLYVNIEEILIFMFK